MRGTKHLAGDAPRVVKLVDELDHARSIAREVLGAPLVAAAE